MTIRSIFCKLIFLVPIVLQCGSSYTERVILRDVNKQIKKARKYYANENYIFFETFIIDALERLEYLPKLRANVYIHSMLEGDEYCYLLENGLMQSYYVRCWFHKKPVHPMLNTWKE